MALIYTDKVKDNSDVLLVANISTGLYLEIDTLKDNKENLNTIVLPKEKAIELRNYLIKNYPDK